MNDAWSKFWGGSCTTNDQCADIVATCSTSNSKFSPNLIFLHLFLYFLQMNLIFLHLFLHFLQMNAVLFGGSG